MTADGNAIVPQVAADGKPIQTRQTGTKEWIDYDPEAMRRSNASALFYPFTVPRFDEECLEWRIKPENIVVKTMIEYEADSVSGLGRIIQDARAKPNIQFEFDCDTGRLVKVDIVK